MKVTTTTGCGSEALPGLLDQIAGQIPQVAADDDSGRAMQLSPGGIRVQPYCPATSSRDQGHKGLDGWKNESACYRHGIAENMMYRLKQLGDTA